MENTRKLIHVGMLSFAVLLRWLNWWQAALCAIAAVLVNVLIMPRIGKKAFREDDLERGYACGMIYYSVSVLVLILTTPLPIAAAAWGIMALGDGSASIVGMRWGDVKWPWSKDKSIAGSIAFLAGGTIAACVLIFITQTNAIESVPLYDNMPAFILMLETASLSTLFLICAITAGVMALVESLPLPIDDNLSVPLGSGAILLGLSHVLLV